MSDSYTQIGTATLASVADARAHYDSGGHVLVHDGSESTLPVTRISTTHSTAHGITTWAELMDHVTTWSNRHPNQNFYIVTLDD